MEKLPWSDGDLTRSYRGWKMSKTAILSSGSCFCNCVAAAFTFLLNCWASVLILETHPLSWNPNNVRAAGRQPNGGSEVTPILLAPCPYKSCLHNLLTNFLVFHATYLSLSKLDCGLFGDLINKRVGFETIFIKIYKVEFGERKLCIFGWNKTKRRHYRKEDWSVHVARRII